MATVDTSNADYRKCLETGGRSCFRLLNQTSPGRYHNVVRAGKNAPTRDKGTVRDSTVKNPGYFFDPNTVLTPFGTDQIQIEQTLTPGRELLTFDDGTILSSDIGASGQSVNKVDDGGVTREGSPNDGELQNISDQSNLDTQGGDRDVGGNKAFPYISPLTATNFSGLEPINPIGEANLGNDGTLYNPQLLDTEGIIYLRQYLSELDEETGAVWRFQYAPQISYTRSSTFVEDKTWGTNVQPSHYNNTSGKKINIQDAILEGMTIGKTVTGAVQALETLMSVTNPDNQDQIAPYAYRLIVGERTFREPISQKHAPFVIEQIQVREELYDTKGEVLMYKVDISLKEVPYYQINDGRKLLLVTQDQRTNAAETCEEISQNIANLTADIKTREQENINNLNNLAAANTTNGTVNISGVKSSIEELNGGTFATNCRADAQAYGDLKALINSYNAKNCKTAYTTEGVDAIQNQFAYKAGIYEILKGRPSEKNDGFFGVTVYDEEGKNVPWGQRLKQLAKKGNFNTEPSGRAAGPIVNVSVLEDINPAFKASSGRQQGSPVKSQDLLPNCPHIVCVDNEVQQHANKTNLDNILRAIDALLNSGNNADYLTLINDTRFNNEAESISDFQRAVNVFFPDHTVRSPLDLNDIVTEKRTICGHVATGENYFGVPSQEIRKEVNKNMNTILNIRDTSFNKKRAHTFPAISAASCYMYIEKSLNLTIDGATDNKGTKCNRDAITATLADVYKPYIERGGQIFTRLKNAVSTSNLRDQFDSDLAATGNNKCANFGSQKEDMTFDRSLCIAAYVVVTSVNKMFNKVIAANETIEYPFSNEAFKDVR